MADKRQIVVPFVIEGGKVLEGSVKVVCNISKGRGADKVELFKELEYTFDYTGVDVADLVDKAATSDVISMQANWRELSSQALKQEHQGSMKMAEWYNRTITRTAPDPMKMLLKRVETGAMKDEELQAFIAQLTAMASK